MTKWLLVVIPLLAAACATIPLTPQQSAGLRDAQRFADEVTTAYRVTPVKVIAYEGSIRPGISWGRYLSVGTPDLAGSDVREKIALPLAGATLDYIPSSPTAVTYRRQWVFDVYRRAVDIRVRFLGATTRQAVESNIPYILKWNETVNPLYVGYEVTPCEALRDLWSHFAMTEPMPTCETGRVGK